MHRVFVLPGLFAVGVPGLFALGVFVGSIPGEIPLLGTAAPATTGSAGGGIQIKVATEANASGSGGGSAASAAVASAPIEEEAQGKKENKKATTETKATPTPAPKKKQGEKESKKATTATAKTTVTPTPALTKKQADNAAPVPATKTQASDNNLNQEHCVIHVHGFHHSGTGFLRSQIHDVVLKGVSSQHEGTRVPEDEGQYLQNVYPVYKKRHLTIHCKAQRTSTMNWGWKYYCPGIADNIPSQPGSKEQLFQQWSEHWDLAQPYLIQKTPMLDIFLFERMKLHPTFHAVIIRHPFHFHHFKLQENPNIMFTWLDVWTHVFTNLRSGEINSFAIVNYEGLVDEGEQAKIQESLGDAIHQACPEQNRNNDQERFLRGQHPTERRLELHEAKKMGDLHKISSKQKMIWDQCEEDPECKQWQQDLEPILKELGYTWERDRFYTQTKAIQKDGILFSQNNLPSQELVEQMQALAVKYSGSGTFH